MRDPRRVAVVVSGRGSNLRALADQRQGYEIVLVASNNPHSEGLEWARAAGFATWTWDSKGIPREEFDAALSSALEDHKVGTIALAGYMRLLSPKFIEAWPGRILNIHPSLLPAYRGLDTHARALAAGETQTGCTVHLVTQELDSGRILASSKVPIEAGDTPATLEARVLEAEHRLYPAALSKFVAQ